jgi:hypothetical protein
MDRWTVGLNGSNNPPAGTYTRLYFIFKCDVTRAETKFRLSSKRTSPFKSAWGVSSVECWQPRCISGSNTGYTKFRGSVKSTGYTLHSPVSPSFPLPCVTVCHHISSGLYNRINALCIHWAEEPMNTARRNYCLLLWGPHEIQREFTPLWDWTRPWASSKHRFSRISAYEGDKVVILTHRPTLPPSNYSCFPFFIVPPCVLVTSQFLSPTNALLLTI